jgi:hypothetical protein
MRTEPIGDSPNHLPSVEQALPLLRQFFFNRTDFVALLAPW